MRRLLTVICLLCCLAGVCRAESSRAWTDEGWADIKEALASDEKEPVPATYRITPRTTRGRLWTPPKDEKGFFNVLLMSTDATDPDHNFGRTDALLLCRVNLNTGDTRVLSLPESSRIMVQGLPEPVALRYVNCFGGPLLTMQTIDSTLDLYVNRYCAMSMDAFISAVDAFGGIALHLTAEDAYALGLSGGDNKLSGVQALRYVQLRRQEGNAGRMHDTLEAVLAQAAGEGSVSGALKLADSLLPALDTNITTDDLVNLTFALFGQETPGAFDAFSIKTFGASETKKGRDFLLNQGE